MDYVGHGKPTPQIRLQNNNFRTRKQMTKGHINKVFVCVTKQYVNFL